MNNKISQFLNLFKIKFKINYKYYLMVAVLSYLFVFLGAWMLPVLKMSKIFNISSSFSNVELATYAFFIFSTIVYFMNTLLLSPRYVSKIIDDKSKYYLLPFDLSVKNFTLFVFYFLWVGTNWIIYSVILLLFKIFMKAKEGMPITINNGLSNLSSGILFFLAYGGLIIAYQMIKRKDSKYTNLFIGAGLIALIFIVMKIVHTVLFDLFNLTKDMDILAYVSIPLLIIIYLIILIFVSKKQNVRL